MSIKDILVYDDPSPASDERLDLTFRLAHRYEAYLIGVVPEDASAVGQKFETMLQQDHLQGEWHTAFGSAASYVARRAQAADLVVLGQCIPDHPGLYAPEDVIFACSRPVIVVPYAASRLDRFGEKVLVAWNGSLESGRAIQDALPLLTMASAVTVMLVDPDGDAEIELAQDLVTHLERHGLPVKAQVIRHDPAVLFVADTLLAQVAELDVDLLIMGAYGHSRLREMILGGVTRDILRNMNVPVLMAR